MGHALSQLKRAGLLRMVRGGVYRLTPEGERLLAEGQFRLDPDTLRDRAGLASSREAQSGYRSDIAELADRTAERRDRQLRRLLEQNLLSRLQDAPSRFVDQVVLDLLTTMGYGGDAGNGRAARCSGDGEGAVLEDALGGDVVYVEAMGSGDGVALGVRAIVRFVGAVDAAGAAQGVLVTTASFTPAARKCANRNPKRIVLIDGEVLARRMVQHGVGVRTSVRHEIRSIDEDYFGQVRRRGRHA